MFDENSFLNSENNFDFFNYAKIQTGENEIFFKSDFSCEKSINFEQNQSENSVGSFISRCENDSAIFRINEMFNLPPCENKITRNLDIV